MKMKKPKAPRVPVLENAFEVNLPKLLRAVKASGRPEVVLVDGGEHTVAVVSETRLAVHLGGRTWMADIVAVPCLNDRVRPLLKCPRAHGGNFQSLYWRAGELACRHCHALRYRSNLAATKIDRARIARSKLLSLMGAKAGQPLVERKPRKWRCKHVRQSAHLTLWTSMHYRNIRAWLERQCVD
jgi:hypothetical protein